MGKRANGRVFHLVMISSSTVRCNKCKGTGPVDGAGVAFAGVTVGEDLESDLEDLSFLPFLSLRSDIWTGKELREDWHLVPFQPRKISPRGCLLLAHRYLRLQCHVSCHFNWLRLLSAPTHACNWTLKFGGWESAPGIMYIWIDHQWIQMIALLAKILSTSPRSRNREKKGAKRRTNCNFTSGREFLGLRFRDSTSSNLSFRANHI